MNGSDRDIFFGLFNDSFPPVMDGVTLTVKNYADWLLHKGLKPCVVTPRMPQMMPTPYPVMPYFSLPIPSRRPYRYGYPRLDLTIYSRLRNTPFALVHAHSPFSAGRLALYASRKQGIPLIGTFHSKYRTDLEHSMRRTPWMVQPVMNRIISFFDECHEVWIPQAQVEETVREYGFKGAVQVVENGNDMATLSRAELPAYKADARRILGVPDGVPVFLFVGQHILEKGIEVIFEAMKLLHEQGRDFRMYYIGTGYARERLIELVKRTGLERKISVLGVLHDRRELSRYYAAADLFLFPSYYDNAPLVVREAAAMGTPAVLPVGSTAAEVIADGFNGFLCERTPQAHARLIAGLLENPEALQRAGRGARDTLVRSWQDVMSEVAGRYRDILRRR
ncbi:MAG: glycosyltransferase family 4 protein [Bacteroidales bacterium]|nr:glycosyltransferase family 4 protein [Bacteroidales bacterium]